MPEAQALHRKPFMHIRLLTGFFPGKGNAQVELNDTSFRVSQCAQPQRADILLETETIGSPQIQPILEGPAQASSANDERHTVIKKAASRVTQIIDKVCSLHAIFTLTLKLLK